MFLLQNLNPGKLYDGHSLFLDKLKDKLFEVKTNNAWLHF